MKPFLRWAGGKNWLTKHIDKIISPDDYNNYHEPFLGGGSMFFHLEIPNQNFLSDLNNDLINAYQQVSENVEAVIDNLLLYENTVDFYYNIRAMSFADPIQQASRFIYLNQTSFNGIYRVNRQGQYNVPYGHRTKDFVQAELLREASIRLNGVHLMRGQFDHGLDLIQPNDLVFLDPPYTITHNNNGFIKYNERLFSIQDQIRLANFIETIIEIGAYYVLTNAAHNEIANIFHMNAPLPFNRASLIGGLRAKEVTSRNFYLLT